VALGVSGTWFKPNPNYKIKSTRAFVVVQVEVASIALDVVYSTASLYILSSVIGNFFQMTVHGRVRQELLSCSWQQLLTQLGRLALARNAGSLAAAQPVLARIMSNIVLITELPGLATHLRELLVS
jgi:hypothetical protein